jgi:hypothetical protein
MSYSSGNERGSSRLLRNLAVVIFACLGTVSCVGITLGETFGDPVEEAGKAIQMWLFVPSLGACTLLLG